MKSPISRRDAIKAAAAGTTLVAGLAASTEGRPLGANERLRVGFIGVGHRGSGHVHLLNRLREDGANIELAAVSEVYRVREEKVCGTIRSATGRAPKRYEDYRELLADKDIDAVCIATPDHWHARQTIDALKAGKHVYCEKPMTKRTDEAFDVVDTWRSTGKIMQVGVQSTSLPTWKRANELIVTGKLGKVLGFQTEYFRNSNVGQWRHYPLEKAMTPQSINWRRWLGVAEGLAPDMPFDRTLYAQWRRFWPFGSGMFTDLFVHRTTAMLKATGLRFPGRVVGAGGIYLEYDGRDVPDVATVVADYNEGAQGLITATMCNENSRIRQLIRGHWGALVFGEGVFGTGEDFQRFQFKAERPQVTLDGTIADADIAVDFPTDYKFLPRKQGNAEVRSPDTQYMHFKNWLEAIASNRQDLCNNPPDLGAAAVVTVNLGTRSYREGKVFFFDEGTRRISGGNDSWARRWEQMSKDHAKPRHVAGWRAGDKGSTLVTPAYMSLGGPWSDGVAPEQRG